MRLNMKRIVVLMLLSGLIGALGIGGGEVKAESKQGIELQTSIGFQGTVKEGEWTPIRFTLTNTTDKDMTGEAFVSVVSSFGGHTTDYIVPAELPKGTAVELTIAIPGIQLNKDNNRIGFYKGSFKDGDLIDIVKGSSYLVSSGTTQSYTIGVIASNPDTLNFMPALNLRGYNLAVIPVKPEMLPDQAVLLDTFNALVINDVATSDWSEKRVEAIENWVRKGGTLILSGGAGYSKTAQAFESIAPVKAAGTATATNTDELVAAGGVDWKAEQPFTISTGSLVEGNTNLSADGAPLAVTRQVGVGNVIYVAFDPSLEPFVSWQGSEAVFARLLQSSLIPMQMGFVINADNSFWNLSNLVDQFPSIKPPNFTLLLVMFVCYMVLAAPVLYVILRKTDRREWTWWLVPVLSIATGIAIFYFGAADKRTVSAHTVQTVELSSQGGGFKSGAFAIFMPSGGTVKAQFDDTVNIKTYSSDGGSGTVNLNGSNQVISDEDKTTVQWRSVSYWSTRKARFEDIPLAQDTGSFKVVYNNSSDGNLELTVTNGTSTDMTNLAVLMNGTAYMLKDLKQGESDTVSIAANQPNTSYYPYSNSIFPYYSGGNNDEFSRQRELLDSYMNRNNGFTAQQAPLVVGFSIDHNSLFQVNGDKVRADNLTMWVQQLGIMASESDSQYTIPTGFIQPYVKESTMQNLNHYGDGTLNVQSGELLFEYALPSDKQIEYKTLNIVYDRNYNNSNYSWFIRNAASGDWVEAVEKLDQAKLYVNSANMIEMKLVAAADGDTRLPQIALEGKVKP